MPILDNVLLEAESESVCVTASNSQSTLRVTVKGSGGLRVDRPGRACVPAKIFVEILSTLSCDRMNVLISGPRKAALLSPSEDEFENEPVKLVAMPVKVN